MQTLPQLPLWLSIALAVLLLSGSFLAFIGAAGLAFFRNFYDRLHMPALGTTLGAALLLAAAALDSSWRAGAPVLRDALILFFLSLSAPLSLMMLSRAAAMRDFTKSWRDSSDNMFWQVARNNETVKTDEQTDRENRREEARGKEMQAEAERRAAQAAALDAAGKAQKRKDAAKRAKTADITAEITAAEAKAAAKLKKPRAAKSGPAAAQKKAAARADKRAPAAKAKSAAKNKTKNNGAPEG